MQPEKHFDLPPHGYSQKTIEEWLHHACTSKGCLDQSNLMYLLQWLKTEVPMNHGRELRFCPRLMEFDMETQKLLLSTLLQNVNMACPNNLSDLLQAAAKHGPSDAWVLQLLNLLQQKIKPSTPPVYEFTTTTKGSYSELLATLKERESSKPKDSWICRMTASVNSRPANALQRSASHDQSPSLEDGSQVAGSQQSAATTVPSLTQSFHTGTPSGTCTPAGLEADLWVDLQGLREAWHTDRLDSANVPSQLDCLVTLTAQQVDLACSHLGFDVLPESSLPIVCQHVTSLGERLSHTSATRLAHVCLQPRVSALRQNASRSLLSAVGIFAAGYPQPIMEGVLVPCLTQHNSGGPQSDLAVRMVKEVFKPQNLVDFLSKLATTREKWNEAVLTLIQALLDAKTSVEGPVLTGLVEQLVRVSEDMSSSKQLAKVVLTLLQKLGQQLTTAHGAGLKQVLQKNTTFLRKPALAALSRLKI